MKAVQLLKYDKRHPKMKLEEVELPELGDNDLLVKVKYAGVNPVDNLIARGNLKFLLPYSLPQTMGNEFVGIVSQTGANVTEFVPGDRIFGRLPLDRIGSVLSVLMYVSYIPQIFNNLNGNYGNPIQPLVAAINCLIWVVYAVAKKRKDWPLFVANFPGIIFGLVTFVTSLH